MLVSHLICFKVNFCFLASHCRLVSLVALPSLAQLKFTHFGNFDRFLLALFSLTLHWPLRSETPMSSTSPPGEGAANMAWPLAASDESTSKHRRNYSTHLGQSAPLDRSRPTRSRVRLVSTEILNNEQLQCAGDYYVQSNQRAHSQLPESHQPMSDLCHVAGGQNTNCSILHIGNSIPQTLSPKQVRHLVAEDLKTVRNVRRRPVPQHHALREVLSADELREAAAAKRKLNRRGIVFPYMSQNQSQVSDPKHTSPEQSQQQEAENIVQTVPRTPSPITQNQSHPFGHEQSHQQVATNTVQKLSRTRPPIPRTRGLHDPLSAEPLQQSEIDTHYHPTYHIPVPNFKPLSPPLPVRSGRSRTVSEKMEYEKARLALNAGIRASLDPEGPVEYNYLSDLGHGIATVVNSSLTAAVSGDDLSKPSPKRPRFPPLKPGPSRIPTPVGMKGNASPRNFTAPVSSRKKEACFGVTVET